MPSACPSEAACLLILPACCVPCFVCSWSYPGTIFCARQSSSVFCHRENDGVGDGFLEVLSLVRPRSILD